MNIEVKSRIARLLAMAVKIAVGSCAAIWITEGIGLQFATSAGIITLLTVVSTKWETVKLSGFRILSFLISVLLSYVIFQNIGSDWIAFGLFIFVIVVLFEWIGWRTTISVNAVIGTHFLTTHDFSLSFIGNELLLVVISITIAVLLNLFQNNSSRKDKIIEYMRDTETRLQQILEELSGYLSEEAGGKAVWDDIISMEKRLDFYIERAYDYQNNTFHSHPEYYIQYFEMRSRQCSVLHNLHYEMKRIRVLPQHAGKVGEYLCYLKNYVQEMNDPAEQLKRLESLIDDIRNDELPASKEEFESRALLYHILMDLEEFLIFKRRFIESIDEKQFRIYWKKS